MLFWHSSGLKASLRYTWIIVNLNKKHFKYDMHKIGEIFGFHIMALLMLNSEVFGLKLDPIKFIWHFFLNHSTLTAICCSNPDFFLPRKTETSLELMDQKNNVPHLRSNDRLFQRQAYRFLRFRVAEGIQFCLNLKGNINNVRKKNIIHI